MAFEISSPSPLTIFSPKLPSLHHRPPTELRFSRWNNANAQPFIRKQRSLKEIEDDIRRERRFDSASKIAANHDNNPENVTTPSTSITTNTTNTNNSRRNENENFKSIGTPSFPSLPSIPGKKSKYSKPPPNPNPNPNSTPARPTHPAFTRVKAPKVSMSRVPGELASGVSIGEDGVSYRIPNAPFEFQYSYTETPKVKPLALREPPFVPFGPSTMARPWTGKAPMTKKKLPEFDSFRLPPPFKKGVKPVQAPGPYLAGMGPKYVKSRDEIMGEPLTQDEIKELIQGSLRSQRQLNMGRDGLTHNMLDNIHAHWKRRRVCKIKCKGVCTVDMDNVRQQLEEKTGGKIIYNRGGVLFLYRGRNYNHRTRPRFPLMLWKPVTPVYPRLIQQPPEGLTMEEAKELRKRARELPPICKLGKNGVYSKLVGHVREAFEMCELVRINCQGMNPSDYRKIGGKLKDLVPCVLLSFEMEHILIWRGRDWKFSYPKSEDGSMEVKANVVNPPDCSEYLGEEEDDEEEEDEEEEEEEDDEEEEEEELVAQKTPNEDASFEMPKATTLVSSSDGASLKGSRHPLNSASEEVQSSTSTAPEAIASCDDMQEGSECLTEPVKSSSVCMEGVILLRKQAIESGSAVILDEELLDNVVVYEKAVTLAKSAPAGPVFRNGPKRVLVQKVVKQQGRRNQEVVREVVAVTEKRIEEKKSSKNQMLKYIKDVYPDKLPKGSLGVDALAKLLA